MDEQNQAFPRVVTQQSQPRRSKTLLMLALFLVLLGGLLFIGSRFLGVNEEDKDGESAKVAPTAIIQPSDTPMPSEEPSPTAKKEASPTKANPTAAEKQTTSSVDSATGLDRAGLTVDILNGSGVSGAASKMSSFLKDLGYSIGSTGNADNFDYTNVTIQVKSGMSKYLPLLKKDIGSSYTVGDTNTALASGSADAVIIIGK
ncbi:MAG: LytR C-terminal domain-containing protein [Candidatus Levybacteria bacterium]|nr:LytR C-terminal domain-containing protein [Candidatus Levybacteria bacterium]